MALPQHPLVDGTHQKIVEAGVARNNCLPYVEHESAICDGEGGARFDVVAVISNRLAEARNCRANTELTRGWRSVSMV